MADEKHPALGVDQNFFKIITTPVKPMEEIKKIMPEHLQHQIGLEKQGILFAAGPLFEEGTDTPIGGCVVIRAKDFDDAKRIADSDPMHKSGARSYTLHRWKINEGSYSVTVSYSDRNAAVS